MTVIAMTGQKIREDVADIQERTVKLGLQNYVSAHSRKSDETLLKLVREHLVRAAALSLLVDHDCKRDLAFQIYAAIHDSALDYYIERFEDGEE